MRGLHRIREGLFYFSTLSIIIYYYVLSKLARTWGRVRPHRGITVIPTCGAAPAPVMIVMPLQVQRTWGRAESGEKTQVCAVRIPVGTCSFCKYENAWPNALRVMPFSSIFADANFPENIWTISPSINVAVNLTYNYCSPRARASKFTIASHRLAAGGMHLGCDVCTWGSEGGGDAPGGAHLGL